MPSDLLIRRARAVLPDRILTAGDRRPPVSAPAPPPLYVAAHPY